MRKIRLYVLVGAFSLLPTVIVIITSRHPGTGPHSVTLTWHAPQALRGITVVGYNIYRRAAEGTSFIKIADKVSGAPYEDRLVSSGRKYFYVVTSVDEVGRESRFSQEATADIP